jgi:hypothetical protein
MFYDEFLITCLILLILISLIYYFIFVNIFSNFIIFASVFILLGIKLYGWNLKLLQLYDSVIQFFKLQ